MAANYWDRARPCVDTSSTIALTTTQFLPNSSGIERYSKRIHSLMHSYLFKFCTINISLYLLSKALLKVCSIYFLSCNVKSIASKINVLATFFLLGEIFRSYKQIALEVSLLVIIFKDRQWWNQITDHILIGALPLNIHLESLITQNKVQAVLSVVESFELKTGLVRPISSQEWISKNVNYMQLPVADLFPLSSDEINKGIHFMHEQIATNRTVFVHCKAGRGRSVSVVLAYLLKYGALNRKFLNFEDAYLFLRSKRPQMYLNSKQKTAVQRWYQQHQLVA